MQPRIVNLLLASALYIFLCSSVEADKTVTVLSVDMELKGSDIIDGLESELENNIIGAKMNVKKNCPGLVEHQTDVYKEGNLINKLNQKLNQPIKEIEKNNLCGYIDSPEPEDDSCSMAEGEHTVKDCNVADMFSNMGEGKYRSETKVIIDNKEVALIRMEVEVKN